MKYAYIGCRTTSERNARGKGLKVFEVSNQDGAWREIQCLMTEANPSYQTMDHENKYLYSVHGDISKVSSYKIQDNGMLEHLNTIDIGCKNPVFIVSEKTNQYLVVAALQGGSVSVIKRTDEGALGEIVHKIVMEGKKEDAISLVHQCIWDQKQEFLFAATQGRQQGYGQVKVFRFNPSDGSLTETDCFRSREFAEPRHISIHPNNRYAYLINEKDNSVTYFGFDDQKGKLTPRQILPTLPDTYTGDGQASALVLSQDGQILVGSNRIHESLVLYRIDQNTGYMKQLGFYPCLGLTPRFVTFSPDYSRFYVANEDSDAIVEMKLDMEKGMLEYTGRIIATESPVCITFK